MRIGSLHITWMSPQQRRELRDVALTHISGPEGQSMIARMARSEVKNYLAYLAEQAEIPFGSAAGFLRAVLAATAGIATTNLAHDEPADSGNWEDGIEGVIPLDSPFNVIDRWDVYDQATDSTVSPFTLDPNRWPEIVTLPSGHTKTCTCPEEDKYPPLPQRVPGLSLVKDEPAPAVMPAAELCAWCSVAVDLPGDNDDPEPDAQGGMSQFGSLPYTDDTEADR